jgi:hypothetical protein
VLTFLAENKYKILFQGDILTFMLSVSVYLNFTVCLRTQIVKMTSEFSPFSDLYIEFADSNDSPGAAKQYIVADSICRVLFWQ